MKKNLKLTSVRIDPDTLEKIGKFADKHHYWTKNGVINSVLTAVFSRFPEKDIYDMVRDWNGQKYPITAVFRIGELPKPNEQ